MANASKRERPLGSRGRLPPGFHTRNFAHTGPTTRHAGSDTRPVLCTALQQSCQPGAFGVEGKQEQQRVDGCMQVFVWMDVARWAGKELVWLKSNFSFVACVKGCCVWLLLVCYVILLNFLKGIGQCWVSERYCLCRWLFSWVYIYIVSMQVYRLLAEDLREL